MGNRIECHEINYSHQQPLKLLSEMILYGSIAGLFAISDLRMAVITKNDVISNYEWNTSRFVLVSEMGLRHKFVRSPQINSLTCYSPCLKYICVHFSQGILKIVDVSDINRESRPVVLKLADLDILQIEFYNSGEKKPSLAILSRITDGRTAVKCYCINLKPCELVPIDFHGKGQHVHQIIPCPQPLYGFFTLENNAITYHYSLKKVAIRLNIDHTFETFCFKSTNCCILGDVHGTLYKMEISSVNKIVTSIHLTSLGKSSIPSCLVPIGNSHLFVGSAFGKPQFLDIRGDRLQVLTELTNIAPTTDFALVSDGSKASTIISCSGAFENSSLSVIKRGLGTEELAVVDLEGIQDIYTLNIKYNSNYGVCSLLLLSFMSHTDALIVLPNGELDSLPDSDIFDLNENTQLASNMLDSSFLIQVTSSNIRLISSVTGTLVDLWKSPKKIVTSSCNNANILIVLDDQNLLSFSIDESGKIYEKSNLQLPFETACLSLSHDSSGRFLICFWNDEHVYYGNSESLEEISKISTSYPSVPRSCLLATFKDCGSFAFVALGDGNIFVYEIISDVLSLFQHVKSAQVCSTLKFINIETPIVIACSDKSTVFMVDSSTNKLKYHDLNAPDIVASSFLNTPTYSNSIVLVSKFNLSISRLNLHQKIFVKSISLKKQARRIVYLQSKNIFGLLSFTEEQVYSVDIYNAVTYEEICSYQMKNSEYGNCIEIVQLDERDYFAVGTGFIQDQDKEPHRGRVIILSYENKNIIELSSVDVKGCVYAVKSLSKNRIVCGINSCVHIFNYATDGKLTPGPKIFGFVTALYLDVLSPDLIVVGDIMKSVAVLRVFQDQLEVVAKDSGICWMSSLLAIDKSHFFGSDCSRNLILFKRSLETPGVDIPAVKYQTLELAAAIHTDEFINRMQNGWLSGEESNNVINSIIFVTVNGTLGVLLQISNEYYELLERVQSYIEDEEKDQLCSHLKWRRFESEGRSMNSFNILDADLLKRFLNLPDEKARKMIENIADTKISIESIKSAMDEMQKFY